MYPKEVKRVHISLERVPENGTMGTYSKCRYFKYLIYDASGDKHSAVCERDTQGYKLTQVDLSEKTGMRLHFE